MALDSTRYLTVQVVAEMFGLCAQTVRNRVNAGTWPAWRDGRQIRFGPEDIDAIKEMGRLKPPTESLTSWERRQRNKRIRSLFVG